MISGDFSATSSRLTLSLISVSADVFLTRARSSTSSAVFTGTNPSVSLTVEGGEAVVTCSPAAQVEFYSDAVWNDSRVTQGEGITTARCRLLPFETFVRAEVVDSEGRRAFSSPVRVK